MTHTLKLCLQNVSSLGVWIAGGYMGVAVPFYHWDQLDSLAARESYLQQRLDATLARQQHAIPAS